MRLVGLLVIVGMGAGCGETPPSDLPTDSQARTKGSLGALVTIVRDSEGSLLGGVDRHALRHTFITRLARANVHPRTAQELARHSSIELTMKHYTHLRSRDLRGAVEQSACATLVPVTFHEPASPRISSPRSRDASDGVEDERVAIQAQGTGAGGGGRNRT